MSISDIHARLAITALLYALIMAFWGLLRIVRRQQVDSSYWGAIVIAEVLFLIQAGLGAFLYFSGIGLLARAAVHILYGVVSILVLPAIFVFTRGADDRRAMSIYTVAFIFMFALTLRSMTTGRA